MASGPCVTGTDVAAHLSPRRSCPIASTQMGSRSLPSSKGRSEQSRLVEDSGAEAKVSASEIWPAALDVLAFSSISLASAEHTWSEGKSMHRKYTYVLYILPE